ncbi:YxlC family protein [Paenibacillus xylanexedens]|uniref:YxlC family protein n=1 Tax=Paenibacillus xylanexedens TaxID=528191 RepID=UPI001C8EB3D7|nr:YxlC family protein [Paenibacillus xylanexedens]MBY0116405.1 YxlC family protein [Paenibacillus xylanexedens]
MSRSDDAQEQEVVERLQQHMKVLDDAFEPTSIPSLGSLEAQVRERKQIRRRANWIEIICFWLVGLLAITFGALFFVSAPALYLGIQALGTAVAVILVVIWAGRRRKEVHHE